MNKKFYITFILLFLSAIGAKAEVITGNGIIEEKTVALDKFEQLSCNVYAEITINKGEEQNVHLKGDSNILDYIIFESEGLATTITSPQNIMLNDYTLEISITVENLKAYTNNAAGETFIKGAFGNYEEMSIEANGSSNINITGDLEGNSKLNLFVNGSGDILLNGSINNTNELNITTQGSGDIDCQQSSNNISTAVYRTSGSGGIGACLIKANDVECSCTGSGSMDLYAANTLNATLHAVGSVYYYGSPTIESNITSIGELVAGDDADCMEATGTLEIESNKEELMICPNPVANHFSIKNLKKATTIRVYDINGGLILHRTVSPNEKINITELPKGVYMVKMPEQTIRLVK